MEHDGFVAQKNKGSVSGKERYTSANHQWKGVVLRFVQEVKTSGPGRSAELVMKGSRRGPSGFTSRPQKSNRMCATSHFQVMRGSAQQELVPVDATMRHMGQKTQHLRDKQHEREGHIEQLKGRDVRKQVQDAEDELQSHAQKVVECEKEEMQDVEE